MGLIPTSIILLSSITSIRLNFGRTMTTNQKLLKKSCITNMIEEVNDIRVNKKDPKTMLSIILRNKKTILKIKTKNKKESMILNIQNF